MFVSNNLSDEFPYESNFYSLNESQQWNQERSKLNLHLKNYILISCVANIENTFPKMNVNYSENHKFATTKSERTKVSKMYNQLQKREKSCLISIINHIIPEVDTLKNPHGDIHLSWNFKEAFSLKPNFFFVLWEQWIAARASRRSRIIFQFAFLLFM